MNPVGNTYELWKLSVQDLKDLQQFFDSKYLNQQFYRKILVRNIFSIIETYLFVTRELIKLAVTTNQNSQKSQLSYEELVILNAKAVTLTNKGEINTREVFYSFEPSLMFTFNCFSKVFNVDKPEYRDINFKKLQKMVKRRNDLTHPKSIEKQIVSNEEIHDLVNGFEWFIATHSKISRGMSF